MKIGGVELNFLGHSGFIMKFKDKVVVVDPYKLSDSVPKADIVLITHSHNDHCSIRDIQKISRNGTIVFCPVDCQSTLMKIKNVEVHIVGKGEVLDFRNFKVECVHSYTLGKHHPQNEGWLGYIIKSGNDIVYFAGDTDFTSEINNLSGYGKKGNNFIAVLPVSGTVNMDSFSAFKAAKVLNPSVAIPHGYGGGLHGTIEDARKFVELCKQNGIMAEVLEKI